MTHEASLIATVAAAFGVAIVFGFIAVKLRMPPLVGYLLAGIAIGPYTRGFVGDVEIASQLAEIGVMLLMFGVGLHFSFEDLMAVRRIAVPGAVLQICIAAALGMFVARVWGWPIGSAVVIGLCVSVASTVVLLRALESRGLVHSFSGRVAISWLIVQDLVMVLVLVLLPAFAPLLRGGGSALDGRATAIAIALTLGKVAAFIILMLVAGRRLFPRLLWSVAKTGSRELFTLCVIAAAVGIAFLSARFFGISFALGAFFAGMMMRESDLSHRAAEESLPLQDAFAVLFFVSVGMLFDPMVLVRQPAHVIAVVAIVMIGTPLIAAAIILAFRYPPSIAVTVGAGLAQIGEFSFIVAALGTSLQLLPDDGRNLVLAAAIVSIALNPLVFLATAPLQRSSRKRPDPLSELPMTVDPAIVTDHVVIVGYGRVGRRIAEALLAERMTFVVIEQNRELVERLRQKNIPAVSGDASESAVLIQGHVARARMLVIATPDTINVRNIVRIARMLNPRIQIVIRTHSDEEADLLRQENIGEVFMGEQELAAGMTRHIIDQVKREPA